MRELKNFIFLTENEILIQNNTSLTIHLKGNDSRAKAIENNKNNLYLIVYNPGVKWVGTFLRNRWYLIPELRYTGKTKANNLINYSFHWCYSSKNGFPKQRELTNSEVKNFREKNYLEL